MTPTFLKYKLNIFASLLFLFTFHLTFAIGTKPIKKNDKNEKFFIAQYENILGTSFEMKIKASSDKQAAIAEKIAIGEIKRLSKIVSTYDKNSEFSLWMKTQNKPIKASKELIEVLSLFDYWKTKTDGALNPAVEAVSQVWKTAEINQILPSKESIQSAVRMANQKHWTIDYTNRTITHLTNVPLILNTFVKSYIIDHATKKVINETAIESIVMNIGGDILVSGNQSESVEIADPKANAINDVALNIVRIQNKFIATSGNYKRGNLIGNQWFSHIVDPRTGTPAENCISASVIASNATDAGALATAFNVLTIAESIELAKQFPDVAYLIVTKDGEKVKSDNWTSQEIATENTSNKNNHIVKNDQWDPAYELNINLELAQIQGGARRPFVAIWVENKDKASVRTLTVWFNKPRWLHDLRAWYNANYSKFNVENQTINSVASATRAAGKYTIKWDGKTDDGEYVKQGIYVLNIEVAREHGSHQLISQEIKVNNKAVKIELASNPEVASASLEIKKKKDE
ncbi:MAG: hypothetical protein RL542_727 [Bacteroidota bacterium]|jgi:thiamine biosynthesis lipoprotein ApbE